MTAKRLFDICASVVGLLVLWPLFVAIAILIKLDDGGPVFFRHERVGRGRRLFRMWKFRSMRVDAPKLGGPLTVAGDPRVTRVGRWLRRSKIDELPQLFNVLAGDMSLVGPRPEVMRYVALYDQHQARVLDLTPGITDPASIRFRDEERLLAEATDPEEAYIRCILPEKIRLNLDYAARAGVLSDIGVILKTFVRIVR